MFFTVLIIIRINTKDKRKKALFYHSNVSFFCQSEILEDFLAKRKEIDGTINIKSLMTLLIVVSSCG